MASFYLTAGVSGGMMDSPKTGRIARSIMIKPASSACNLECGYCFYKDEASNRRVACHPFMEERTVVSLLEKGLEGADTVTFAFQGGEPSLVGLDWFKRFVELEKELNQGGTKVNYGFQTNGTLLDDEWGRFFHDNHFLVGISCDGFPKLHNLYRKRLDASRSSDGVFRGIDAMLRNNVDLNVLAVVTDAVADNIDAMWDFFMSKDLRFQQYIACLDPLDGDVNRFLDPVSYGKFLVGLAKKWVAALQTPRPVSIRLFDNFISVLMGYPPEECDMNGHCSIQYVVESDGTVYPCDFYCTDRYELGNINTETIGQLDTRRDAIDFLHESDAIHEDCKVCPIFPICRAGCKRNRDASNKFRFCESYRILFDEMGETFVGIAQWMQERGGVKL